MVLLSDIVFSDCGRVELGGGEGGRDFSDEIDRLLEANSAFIKVDSVSDASVTQAA